MISKVPLLLFVFALYCADVKTLVQKPGLASFLEQFVLQDEKTPEFAKLFQDRNNDKINENSENINDYIGKNDVKNKESKANAENNKNKDEFASENSSDESEVAVKNTQKNHFSDDEINMNSRSNEELKNDDWDSANEEKQLNQKEQIQVQQDEDFEDDQSNDDNNSDDDDEQKFKVKFSNSRHQRQMPFEHFPSSKLHPFPKQPWEHASFGRSLRIGSFRKKNDDEQDDQFTSLLNTINAEEELDEDKISKLRKLYKNENEDFEDPSIMEDLQDYQNDFLKHQHSGKIDPLRKKNPKVGFNPGFNTPKMKVASLTEYVRKAIAKGKPKLQSKVPSHNPPLVVEEVPKCPIVFKLKHVEGFSSLTPFGDSKGFYSDRFYAFTQAKFNELRFSYDVQIKPLGLYTIEDKINIILHDAPVKLHFSLDKEMQTKLLHFEYVNPQVRVEYKGNLLVSTGINFFLNQADPVIKQKLVEIVSRDSKMMLKEFISENK